MGVDGRRRGDHMARPGSEVFNQVAGFFENSTEQGLAGRRQPSYLGPVKEADDRPLLLSKGSSAPPRDRKVPRRGVSPAGSPCAMRGRTIGRLFKKRLLTGRERLHIWPFTDGAGPLPDPVCVSLNRHPVTRIKTGKRNASAL